jgi:hypothetical protein
MSRLTVILSALAVACAGCGLFNWMRPERQFPGIPADALKVPAAYVQATGVALTDFLDRERRENLRTARDGGGEVATDGGLPADAGVIIAATVDACFERPEAYETRVRYNGERGLYEIYILPLPEVCMGEDAWALIGGGARYEIDAASFTILRSSLLE